MLGAIKISEGPNNENSKYEGTRKSKVEGAKRKTQKGNVRN